MKFEPILDEQLVESLRQDILDQADQIGGLVSEMEQLRDVYTATAELLQIREKQVQQLLKDVSDSQQQLAASQTEAAALRGELQKIAVFGTTEARMDRPSSPRDISEVKRIAARALATPSAAAERVQAVIDAVRSIVDVDGQDMSDETGPLVLIEEPLYRALHDAFAALDAATGEEALTVEEVTS